MVHLIFINVTILKETFSIEYLLIMRLSNEPTGCIELSYIKKPLQVEIKEESEKIC